jgi:hypothetical protein
MNRYKLRRYNHRDGLPYRNQQWDVFGNVVSIYEVDQKLVYGVYVYWSTCFVVIK